MRDVFRRHGLGCAAALFALAFVASAGVASAQTQQVCLILDDGLGKGHPLLYRLVVTYSGGFVGLGGHGARTVVGIATGVGDPVGVVTGGGAQIGGKFEISLRTTGFNTPLHVHSTHIVLDPPAFTSGIFRSANLEYSVSKNGVGQITEILEGTAAIVSCPPSS